MYPFKDQFLGKKLHVYYRYLICHKLRNDAQKARAHENNRQTKLHVMNQFLNTYNFKVYITCP